MSGHGEIVPPEDTPGDEEARGDEGAPGDREELEEREEPEDREERRSGPPSEDRVRLELVLFAELIQRLEQTNSLPGAVPFLLGRLGDLRRLLFDYEVRGTERLLPIEDPAEREARRIIREVEESKREMMEGWRRPWTPPDTPDETRDEGNGRDADDESDGTPDEGIA